MASPTKPTKKTRSGQATRRKVAQLAAVGHSNPEIARELSLTERRIEQIVAEAESKAMIAHFAESVDRQRMAAESILLDACVEKAAAGDLAWAALLEQRITNAERRGGGAPGTAVQVNVQQGNAVSLDELLAAHRPVGVVE